MVKKCKVLAKKLQMKKIMDEIAILWIKIELEICDMC